MTSRLRGIVLMLIPFLILSGCLGSKKTRDAKADLRLAQKKDSGDTEKGAKSFGEIQTGFSQEPREGQAS